MQCPKCHKDNPETAQYCVYCHAPIRFNCPSCKHVQDHGGKCDQCGLDFGKYASMLVFQMETQVKQERARVKGRNEIIKQVLLLPITGGFSLLKYFRNLLRGE